MQRGGTPLAKMRFWGKDRARSGWFLAGAMGAPGLSTAKTAQGTSMGRGAVGAPP